MHNSSKVHVSLYNPMSDVMAHALLITPTIMVHKSEDRMDLTIVVFFCNRVIDENFGTVESVFQEFEIIHVVVSS